MGHAHRPRSGRPGRPARRWWLGISLVAVLVAGCTGRATVASVAPTPVPTASTSPPPRVTVVPAAGTLDVAPDTVVRVSVTHGRLQRVTLVGAHGEQVPGVVAPDATSWVAGGLLAPDTGYTVTATVLDGQGRVSSTTSSLHTLKPATAVNMRIAPLQGETVGVGMPIVVYFTAPVVDRAAVERRLVVTSSVPVTGGWHWMSPTEVHYRPKVYWPAGTTVQLTADITGVRTGPGAFGDDVHHLTFHVGDAVISTVDVATHTLTVTRNGIPLRTIPVTTGKQDFLTRGGIKVVLEKLPHLVMDAATVGIAKTSPDYYKLDVFWDLRVTWSGEFLHAAPWSTGSQGQVNVSHGCVGMSTADAQWLFNLSHRGDIVTVVNSPRPLEPGNGWTDWNLSWAQWVAGSALGQPQG